MAGRGDLISSTIVVGDAVDGTDGQQPTAVRSCSRLGRVANPPGFSLPSWLRAGRRR
ncbi:hypothetical protein ACAG25_02245 [Mycobacterium sp. pV006]|uniref:hypothetical protein n=1 Tax=Mycobacterium sp. pV006 TaxID=3238983 RepID=UPI00351BACB6